MVDYTESGILKDEPNNAHRRLQQGFEVLRPAFLCNDKVNFPEEMLSEGQGIPARRSGISRHTVPPMMSIPSGHGP
jgi:hypothetical protein